MSGIAGLRARYWRLSKSDPDEEQPCAYRFDKASRDDLCREPGLEHLANLRIASDLSLSKGRLKISLGIPLWGEDTDDWYAWAAADLELVVFASLHLADGEPGELRAIGALFARYAKMAEEAAAANERGKCLTGRPYVQPIGAAI